MDATLKTGLKAAFFAAALNGCANPDFVTDRGVDIYLNGHDTFINLQLANRLDEMFVDRITEFQDFNRQDVLDCMRGAEVVIVNVDQLQCKTPPCSGTIINKHIEIGDRGCATNSSYIHEMVHLALWCMQGVDDPNHQDKRLWIRVDQDSRQDCK